MTQDDHPEPSMAEALECEIEPHKHLPGAIYLEVTLREGEKKKILQKCLKKQG